MSTTFHSRILSDTTTPRKKQVFAGARKTLFEGGEPGTYICHFTDMLQKDMDPVSGKGVINNRISELLFSQLAELNIPTHFMKRINMREQLIRATEPLPIRLKVYNCANKNLHNRFLIERGTQLPKTLFEFQSRTTVPHVVSREHIVAFGWSNEVELDDMVEMTQRINDFLSGFFSAKGLRLISFHAEFGHIYTSEFMDQSELLLIDEISPDTFELQDIASGDFLSIDLLDDDGDSDLATAATTYQYIAERLGILNAVNAQSSSD